MNDIGLVTHIFKVPLSDYFCSSQILSSKFTTHKTICCTIYDYSEENSGQNSSINLIMPKSVEKVKEYQCTHDLGLIMLLAQNCKLYLFNFVDGVFMKERTHLLLKFDFISISSSLDGRFLLLVTKSEVQVRDISQECREVEKYTFRNNSSEGKITVKCGKDNTSFNVCIGSKLYLPNIKVD